MESILFSNQDRILGYKEMRQSQVKDQDRYCKDRSFAQTGYLEVGKIVKLVLTPDHVHINSKKSIGFAIV